MAGPFGSERQFHGAALAVGQQPPELRLDSRQTRAPEVNGEHHLFRGQFPAQVFCG